MMHRRLRTRGQRMPPLLFFELARVYALGWPPRAFCRAERIAGPSNLDGDRPVPCL